MHKITRKLGLIILFCIILNIFIFNKNFAYESVYEDDALLISGNDIEEIQEKLDEISEYGNVIFKTISLNEYGSAENYAKNYYMSLYNEEDGCIFLIDMDNRVIYIAAQGNLREIFTDSKAEIITDNIYAYASDEEYGECVKKGLDQMMTLLKGGKIPEPMKIICNLLISFEIVLLFNFFLFKKLTTIKKATVKEIAKVSDINISFDPPNVKKISTKKVYCPPPSSSDGGSFGGGGSSGGGRWRRNVWRWPWILIIKKIYLL